MDESGQVFISIKECKALAITESTDVYCIIQLEQQKVRTSICSNVIMNGRAEWNEGYTFDVTTDVDMSVKVWGKSKSFPNGRLLGSLVIPTATAKNQAPVETWTPLTQPSPSVESPCGELYFRTSYINSTSKVGFNDFTILKLIGKGAFGKVMLVRKNDTGRLYAMKQLEKDHILSVAAVTFTLTERNVLKTYNHPFVVSLKYSFQTKRYLYMVLDYVGGGELFYHMAERGAFDEDTVRFYAAQVVLALGFLHDHGVTYRDLKPENLLLDIHGNICLCDFGLCKEQVDGENTFTLCGSPEYMAPEVLQGKGYGRSVDWWALGTLMYEMLTGLPPFYSEDPIEMSQNILSAPIYFPDHLSRNITGLIVQLLRRNPSRRLGSGPNDAEEIKAHPFFATVDWKKIIRKEIEPPFKPHLNGKLDVTYFDPNCTEAPIGFPDDLRTSPALSNAEDCFAQFSFVAPSDLSSTPRYGSTPHQLRRLPASPALGSSSPVLPSSYNSNSSSYNPLTPTMPHPLIGGGIPRSQGSFVLSNYSQSPRSSASPLTIIAAPRDSFNMRGVEHASGILPTQCASDEESLPETFSPSNNLIQVTHNTHPPLSSLPIPDTSSQPLPLHNSCQPSDTTPPPYDPAHPLRYIPRPDAVKDAIPPQPVEETSWIPHFPLHSLSESSISRNHDEEFIPTTIQTSVSAKYATKERQPRLASSTSSPDLSRPHEEEMKEKDVKEKKKLVESSPSSKKLGGFMSLFRKTK